MKPVTQSAWQTAKWRAIYAAAALAIIAAGLLWRWPGLGLPAGVAKYGGSVWWGALVYASMRVLLPHVRVTTAAMCACTLAALVEFSQLWHAPWLDAFRSTKFGVLLLGRYFSWWDIASYWAGIALAGIADLACRVRCLTAHQGH